MHGLITLDNTECRFHVNRMAIVMVIMALLIGG
jgi:hypothetical protein